MDNTEQPAEGFIAIVGQWRSPTPEFGKMPLAYIHAVNSVGGHPRVLSTFPMHEDEVNPEGVEVVAGIDPDDASVLEGATGLLIPGGGDIDPSLYGRKPHPRTYGVSLQRDRFELTLLEAALSKDLPILAICHGMQLLNVQQGGTLDQHIADRHNLLEHDRDRPRAEPAHDIRIKPGCLLERVLGGQRAAVNSHHHQGLGVIAPSLEEVAWAEDSILEAVVARENTWVVGVQWHPEAMAPMDKEQLKLFQAFVEAAADYEKRTRVEARSA